MNAIQSTLQEPDSAAVMFHHFCGGEHLRGQGALDAEELAFLIEAIGRDRILPAREWLQARATGAVRPGQICLTFDDSLRCQVDVAVPVLKQYGLTGFFFVNTCHLSGTEWARLEVYRYFRTAFFPSVDRFYEDFLDKARGLYGAEIDKWLVTFDHTKYPHYPVLYSESDICFQEVRDQLLGRERYFIVMDQMLSDHGCAPEVISHKVMMGTDHLRELHRAGHVIGMHSHTHPTQMKTLTPGEQAQEYWNNYDAIASVLGEGPIAMSHPSNSYSDETLEILRELKISIGFRADPHLATNCPLQLPRIDHMLLMREFRS